MSKWTLAYTVTGVAILAVGAAWAAGRDNDAAVVRAQRFELVDATGKLRGALSVDAEGASLMSLNGASGNAGFEVRVSGSGDTTWLSVKDANGTQRIMIVQSPLGAQLKLQYDTTATGINLELSKEGPSLSFFDNSASGPLTNLSEREVVQRVYQENLAVKPRAILGHGSVTKERGAVSIMDHLKFTATGKGNLVSLPASSFLLFDADGKCSFKAP